MAIFTINVSVITSPTGQHTLIFQAAPERGMERTEQTDTPALNGSAPRRATPAPRSEKPVGRVELRVLQPVGREFPQPRQLQPPLGSH